VRIPVELEGKSPQEIIEWSLKTFGENLVQITGMGAEGMVIMDMYVKLCNKLGYTPKIFTIDTGRLPEETYELIERANEKYKIKINIVFPNNKLVEEMVNKYGPNLFYKSIELRKLCCKVRKLEPLNRILKNVSAWLSGLRRGQSVTRKDTKNFELEEREIDGQKKTILKINPLAYWTEEMVWEYLRENNVPYNSLHDKGYPSIGCEPCTRAVKEGEDPRSGRWWWETPEKRECGIHEVKKIDFSINGWQKVVIGEDGEK